MASLSKALVLNSGSSTLKWALVSRGERKLERSGLVAWKDAAGPLERLLPRDLVFDAVAHRIVHGGERYSATERVTEELREGLESLVPLAPLHLGPALEVLDAAVVLWPRVPQYVAFDTAFHATLPEANRLYGLPRAWRERFGLRRFGFHGLSVGYATARLTALLGHCPERVLVCHLGAGCSVTAVKRGASLDTSMGYTPLEGPIMATRSGSVDPGIILQLLREGVGVHELEEGLTRRGGWLGLGGVEDFRELVRLSAEGSQAAKLAYEAFVTSVTRALGAMLAVLGGVDALVFTGGIGEHQALVRAQIALQLAFLGLELDAHTNQAATGDRSISAPGKWPSAWVIEAREELEIARTLPEELPLAEP